MVGARKGFLLNIIFAAAVFAQSEPAPQPPGSLTIDLKQALERARQYGGQIQAANIAAQLAKEDRVQANAASLPSISASNQYIYTEGNGTPSGVFVANDGVHVYNEQLNAHEELLSFVRRGEIRVAQAAEAVAKARADVAERGLKITVVGDYYAIASAERRVKNTQTSLGEARNFLDITQKQEHAGEAAHADVIKAQLQQQQRERDVQDASLTVQKAKIALAVLIFPSLQTNYEIVDDLDQAPPMPAMPEANSLASMGNPDVRAAQANAREARLSVSVARYAYLPSMSLDVWYGLDANHLAFRSYNTAAEERSNLPNFSVPYRQNLGYVAQASLNFPIWNWGAIHSKVKQASLKATQADTDLNIAKKQVQADLASGYAEAQTAQTQVQSLRESSQLAAESLRLTLLRYQAGEATSLEVVDAQSTAALARGSYNDGLLRYRVALANLQTLMGTF